MAHSKLTRWIEDAEARDFSQAAMFERKRVVTESHYLHLGDAVAKLPSWLRHAVSYDSLAAIGCHALAYVRHPLSRSHH